MTVTVTMQGNTVKKIACMGHSVCVILQNDQVKCWGLNSFGHLGLGDTIDRARSPGQMGNNLPYVDLGTVYMSPRCLCPYFDNERDI